MTLTDLHERLFTLQQEIRDGKLDKEAVVFVLQGIRSDLFFLIDEYAEGKSGYNID
jgi:hypothetical protein